MMLELKATIGKTTFVWPVNATVDNPMLQGLLQKGFGETLRDATAPLAGATTDEKVDAIQERLDKLIAGTYVFKGTGTRGGTLSDEEEALHLWLQKQGHDGKKGDLYARMEAYVSGVVLASITDQSKRAELEADADALAIRVDELTDDVRQLVEGQSDFKDLLVGVKAKRGGKKAAAGLVLPGM
jgi:hypothetical protein